MKYTVVLGDDRYNYTLVLEGTLEEVKNYLRDNYPTRSPQLKEYHDEFTGTVIDVSGYEKKMGCEFWYVFDDEDYCFRPTEKQYFEALARIMDKKYHTGTSDEFKDFLQEEEINEVLKKRYRYELHDTLRDCALKEFRK